MSANTRIGVVALAALAVGGCDRAYYGAMKKLGIEKRHILVDRVEEARDGQEEAKEEFKTTLQRFKELTGYDGGDLEDIYEELKESFERCEKRAEEVRDRIDAVEEVAEDLFDEWRREAEEIENREFRAESRRLLKETEARYRDLAAAMRRAEERMEPPLNAFRDQVLFLKHNLNAHMIASLEGNVAEIEDEVDRLIQEMEKSIEEANRFVESMPLE